MTRKPILDRLVGEKMRDIIIRNRLNDLVKNSRNKSVDTPDAIR